MVTNRDFKIVIEKKTMEKMLKKIAKIIKKSGMKPVMIKPVTRITRKMSGKWFIWGIILLLLLGGCAGAQTNDGQPVHGAGTAGTLAPGQTPRFEVIYEHGETKNLGGFSVIRDNATGQEYLAVIGMNGSSSIIMLKPPTSAKSENAGTNTGVR